MAEIIGDKKPRKTGRSRERKPGRPHAQLYVCGLNHTRASLAVRERYALAPEAASAFGRELCRQQGAEQALVLSTCNRMEIYAFSSDPKFAARLRGAFMAIGELADPAAGAAPIYEYSGIEAVRHLFAVGAGLDSMILGENQIKQQLRQAWEQSRASGTAGTDLHRLVEASYRCGKRIRTETELNVGTLDVGKAAVLKGEETLGRLSGRVCMVIGVGKVGRIAARAIAERAPSRLILVNRTLERAHEIAEELRRDGQVSVQPEAYGIEALPELFPEAELIIGAAYAPELILDWELYHRVADDPRRPERVCLIDAAVPRIFDPALGRLGWVELSDIEQMSGIIEANRRKRMAAAQQAWQIVAEEVEKYQAARQAAELAPAIRRLTQQFESIFEEEGDAADSAEPLSQREHAARRRMKQRLLHAAITELKALKERG